MTEPEVKPSVEGATQNISKPTKTTSKNDDDDFKRLIIPKKIVSSKLTKAMLDMKKMCETKNRKTENAIPVNKT